MRTKTLLLTAALTAAGVASSMAQVYSVNAVGYVNITVKQGANLIANPLNTGGNTLAEVLPTVPEDTSAVFWNPGAPGLGANNPSSAQYIGGTWLFSGAPSTVEPGKGFYLILPPGPDAQVTFVGEVPQGTPVPGAPSIVGSSSPSGKYNLIASQVPQQGRVSADLAYPALEDDSIVRFNPATQNFFSETWQYIGGAWNSSVSGPSEPVINIAEGFFLLRADAATTSWTRNFSVNP
jgi:hypothetical protein